MFDRKIHPTQPQKIKVGDIVSLQYYTRVKSVANNGLTLLVNDLDDGKMSEIQVVGEHLIARSFSADQYHEEYRITKTQAAELLVGSVNRPFTVSFTKSDGTERVLRGRLIKPEPLLGRSMVEDLETAGERIRQVDHRTINWIVIEGTKYIVK